MAVDSPRLLWSLVMAALTPVPSMAVRLGAAEISPMELMGLRISV